jgi:hypothetical protein
MASWLKGLFGQPNDKAGATPTNAAPGRAMPASTRPKISISIGFANFSGDDLQPLVDEDLAALTPLFETVRPMPAHQIPSTQIIFVYAHLDERGCLRGTNSSGLRQIVQVTKAKLVVLASPNSSASIIAAGALPGPREANFVFTTDRNGPGFARFFVSLFERMRDGEDMLMAWVHIAPQGPNMQRPDAPGLILAAEAGKLAFPPVQGTAP